MSENEYYVAGRLHRFPGAYRKLVPLCPVWHAVTMLRCLAFGLLLFQIPLAPAQSGVAAGIVRDAAGAPAAGVRVAAMAQTSSPEGNGEGALVSLTETDSAGRYRLENIPPGRYYIQAGLLDFPTYYPGGTSKNDATNIQITPGAVIERLDFTLVRPVGVRVSGRVPLYTPEIGVVALIGGPGPLRLREVSVEPDGTFEFPKVMPGNYTLQALPSNSIPILPIVVADKDIDVGTPAGPGVKVSGFVGAGPLSPRPAGQKIVLTGKSAWAQFETVIGADGRFEVWEADRMLSDTRIPPYGHADVEYVFTVDDRARGPLFIRADLNSELLTYPLNHWGIQTISVQGCEPKPVRFL